VDPIIEKEKGMRAKVSVWEGERGREEEREGESSQDNLRKRVSELEGSKMKGEECNYYNSDLLHHLKTTSI
jgi:hypothetical protein